MYHGLMDSLVGSLRMSYSEFLKRVCFAGEEMEAGAGWGVAHEDIQIGHSPPLN